MNYLCLNPDPYHTEKTINDLKARLLKDGDPELNFSVFQTGHDAIDDIVAVLRTVPFGAPAGTGHRLVILKNARDLSEPAIGALTAYLKNPSAHTTLVIDAGPVAPRGKAWDEMASYLKDVTSSGGEGKRFDSMVTRELAAATKTIAVDALDLLRRQKGSSDLLGLKNELEKLILFTGERTEITKRDIEIMVGKTLDDDVFRLLEAISRKDASGVLAVLNELWEGKSQPHEVIGLLAWHYRKLYLAGTPSEAVRGRMKRNIDILLSTDVMIKTSALPPQTALEVAIFKLF
ncbi:MAG: DNA polymerase III subunit delta [Candidatus Omnitrophica bacterium]|nr:DNA polymerase III subunit delta [Candidatus Omnitrophota bacterium]